MNDFEEKYKMFGMNDEMIKSFQNYSVGLNSHAKNTESFSITTVVIEKAVSQAKTLEKNNAKLV
jgi:hypothetical protein